MDGIGVYDWMIMCNLGLFLCGVLMIMCFVFLMRIIFLLVVLNIFMMFVWYGYLKWRFFEGKIIFMVIFVLWGIVFFEYCLMVFVNCVGYLSGMFMGY